MRRRGGQIDEIDCAVDDRRTALEHMRAAAEGRDAWLNLRPLVDADELDTLPKRNVLSVFSVPGPPLPIATWVPGQLGRKGPSPTEVGLAHPRPAKVLDELSEAGVVAPNTWQLRADHPGRGVVYHLPDGSPVDEALDWMLRAIEALSPLALDGAFRASFHRR